MTLTAGQCSLIAQVIPVILLALAVERRFAFANPPPWLAARLYTVAVIATVCVAEMVAISTADDGAGAGAATFLWLTTGGLLSLVLGQFVASVFIPDEPPRS